MLEEFYEDILKEDLTVLASRPLNGKMQITLNFLFKYGIQKKKKILMFQIDDPSSYYTEKLVSLISKIDEKEIRNYFHPCNYLKETFHIKEKPFIKAIETLGNSSIIMCDLAFSNLEIDILDYILEYDEEKDADIIILNGLEGVIKKSNGKISMILEKLKEYAKENHVHFIILASMNRIAEQRNKPIITDINYYEELEEKVNFITFIYRLKEQNRYTNKLELITYNHRKKEVINCKYNEKTNEIERTELNEKRRCNPFCSYENGKRVN